MRDTILVTLVAALAVISATAQPTGAPPPAHPQPHLGLLPYRSVVCIHGCICAHEITTYTAGTPGSRPHANVKVITRTRGLHPSILATQKHHQFAMVNCSSYSLAVGTAHAEAPSPASGCVSTCRFPLDLSRTPRARDPQWPRRAADPEGGLPPARWAAAGGGPGGRTTLHRHTASMEETPCPAPNTTRPVATRIKPARRAESRSQPASQEHKHQPSSLWRGVDCMVVIKLGIPGGCLLFRISEFDHHHALNAC